MGMFDYVNFRMECPKCGEIVSEFQSKDSYCNLYKVDPTSVVHFYGSCKCGVRLVLDREDSPGDPRKDPYTLEEVAELGFSLTYVDRK